MSPSIPTHPRLRVAAAALVATVLSAVAVAAAAPAAHADAFGQLGAAWGTVGTGASELYRASELGVDSTDDSVYLVDQNQAGDAYRLRKLTSSGQVKASVSIARTAGAGQSLGFLKGVAVDPARNRVYLLQNRYGLDPTLGGLVGAEKILVFSTDDSTGTLHAPADVPTGVVPVPDPTGANAIVAPQSFAVDPASHDLVIASLTRTTPRRAVVQRIAADGTPGTRFVDTANLMPTTRAAAGLAVGLDGTVYIHASGNGGFYRLPASLATLEHLDWTGTVSASISPTSVAGLEGWRPTAQASPDTSSGGAFGYGPQLSISPDGDRLYWVEIQTAYDATVGGSMIVRGFSIADRATKVVYGDGTMSCRITAPGSPVAAGKDGKVFVLDRGDIMNAAPPTFGQKLLTFGPGGTGCPAPVASFKVGPTGDDVVTVEKGSTVTFDASGSDLHGATPTKLNWDLDGSGAFATEVTGSPAALTTTLVAKKVGTFKIGLKMKVSGSTLGDPPVPPVKTLKVVSPAPTASFSASSSSPKPDQAVTFDGSASVDPTGSPDATPTNDLKAYAWEFGDGQTQTTPTPTVTHAFANGATTAASRTVKLVVTSHDDVASAPVTRTVTVQGQPVVTQPPTTTDETPPEPTVTQPPPTDPGTGPGTVPTIKGKPPVSTFAAPKPVVKGTKITIPLTLPGAGKLAVTSTIKVKGKAIAYDAASKAVLGGKGTVTLLPGVKARAALKKAKGKVKVTVKITFTATGAAAFTRTTTVSVKG